MTLNYLLRVKYLALEDIPVTRISTGRTVGRELSSNIIERIF